MDITSVAGAALEATKIVVNPSGYLIAQLTEVMSKKVAKSAKDSPAELPSLRVQAERQELEMRIAEAQAKVAQEIAIARRIESADEVEIEEFYEYSGDGKAGIKIGLESVGAEAGISGKRVSKRVYRFKGANANSLIPKSEA